MAMLGWRRRWPEWAGWVAVVWSLVYGALGVYWTAGGAGFPFGSANDRAAELSVLRDVRQDTGAPVIAVLGLVGAIVALFMTRGWGGRTARVLLLAFGWTLAVSLTVVIPDFRVLVVVAYAPILAIGAPFGWPENARFFEAIPWPVLNQAVCIVGGLAWAATAIAYRRRTSDACIYCGRGASVPRSITPDRMDRWARWGVAVAVIVPVIYALTRYAWALGIPLGITEQFFRQGEGTGLWWNGAALGTLAVIGAVLTTGLTRRWSEVFPRWIPFVGGKAVPRALVIVPATFVSVIVTAAGLMFIRKAIDGTFRLGEHRVTLTENWAALWPELLWPLWGISLGIVTLAYHFRTRRKCEACGRL